MATILYVANSGSNDPTNATMPFVMALGAAEAGHQAKIALVGEATYLMKDYIAEQIHGVGWPPLKELQQRAINQGVAVHV